MTGPAAINREMRLAEWAMLGLLAAIWGGAFFFVGVAVAAFEPFTVVALRVGLAAATLWLVIALTGAPMRAGLGLWAAFLVMGVLNNAIPFSLITWGQTEIDSGLAAILNATTPIFTVIVAHFLTSDEGLTPTRLGGVALGALGVAVLMGWDALAGVGGDLAHQAAILGAAVAYAFAAVFGRRFRRLGVPPMTAAAGQLTGSSLVMIPAAFLLETPAATGAAAPAAAWLAVLTLATLSTAFAYLLYFRILASAGAANLSLVTVLVPVTAILLGAAFLGERFGPTDFAGLALIALGLGVIDGRPVRAIRRWARGAAA